MPKLPFALGIGLAYRVVLPGAVLMLLILPMIPAVASATGYGTPTVFGVGVLVFGWALSVLDMPIYMLFEGRRFWPKRLLRCGLRQEADRLENLKRNDKENLEQRTALRDDGRMDTEEFRWLTRESEEYWVELRQFPMTDQGEFVARFPTRVGN